MTIGSNACGAVTYDVSMTKYVPKGANRAATYRRRAKHAQRTPLPPKGSGPIGNRTVEVLQEIADEQKAKKEKRRGAQ